MYYSFQQTKNNKERVFIIIVWNCMDKKNKVKCKKKKHKRRCFFLFLFA